MTESYYNNVKQKRLLQTLEYRFDMLFTKLHKQEFHFYQKKAKH